MTRGNFTRRNYDMNTHTSTYARHAVNTPAYYPIGEADGSHLSSLERDILARIPINWSMDGKPSIDWMDDTRTPGEKAAQWTPSRLDHESAVIVYRGEFGIAMGVVRSRRPAGYAGRTEDMLEASPFPGGWEEVELSRVLLVRHPQAL